MPIKPRPHRASGQRARGFKIGSWPLSHVFSSHPWIAYPKAGKLGTDLSRDILAALTAEGIQPVRQVTVDETWSALRFRPA
jgi:hypothetical protein